MDIRVRSPHRNCCTYVKDVRVGLSAANMTTICHCYRETDRQTDRQTDRHTNIRIYGQLNDDNTVLFIICSIAR